MADSQRKILIAGNWKMNLLRQSALQLTQQLLDQLVYHPSIQVAVCPPHVYLREIGEAVKASFIALGGQNMHAADEGAFTGEVSGKMLQDVGCQYVILGHSERRQFFGETDATIHQKILAAQSNQLTPIVCLGESLAQREAGTTQQVIQTQFEGCLQKLAPSQMQRCVIAYEPVWAIGTGRTATPEQAEEVHAQIRALLTSHFGPNIASQIQIQYGGSVKGDNALELLSQPNIDGALVGGASLKSDSFAAIVEGARQALSQRSV